MLLTSEQMKHLELDGEDQFRFVNDGSATNEEKQSLLDLDDDYVAIYNTHLITNYQELKK